MTFGGKFFAITGAFWTLVCLGIAGVLYLQELAARSSLPAEMQTPEMIQRHYDGEVILGSVTFAIALIMLGILSALAFGILAGICEIISAIFSKSPQLER